MFRFRSRPLRSLTTAVVGAALFISLPAFSHAGQPSKTALAHAAGTCKLAGQERKLGPTYVTAASVGGGASCKGAFKLVKSYYHCRVKHGGVSGHCGGVEGYKCTEHRFLVIKVQFNAKVTCTRGRATIRHEFTQFT